MNQRDQIMKIAASQIGYKETGDDWTKYGAWYGMNGNPWCAMFVSWCAAQAKIPQDIIPKMAYVPYIITWFKSRGRYKPLGSYTPRKGDIVFFGDSDHVGLVEGVSGNNVVTIEGNTSANGNVSSGEGVYRRTRPLGSGSWVMGFGIPNYQEEEEDEVKYYEKIAEIPSWAKPSVQKAIDKGILQGDKKGLHLSEEDVRMFVYLDRMGLIGKVYNKVEELPDWAKPAIQKVIDRGVLKGDSKGLGLSEEDIRMFVYMERLGLLE